MLFLPLVLVPSTIVVVHIFSYYVSFIACSTNSYCFFHKLFITSLFCFIRNSLTCYVCCPLHFGCLMQDHICVCSDFFPVFLHFVRVSSRASAAALSTVLKTTTLSYGNMRFSGTCPAETPRPIKIKFSTIYNVDEITRFAKNGCNRLARGGPTDRWNITSKTFHTITCCTVVLAML
jgi:hypothetical protein